MEKARLPSPAEHASYKLHRRQLWTQILLPILAALLVIIAVVVITSIATFGADGEVGRWAAVSIVWMILPLLAASLLLLVLFLGLIYGMARLLAIIPPYTGQAQKVVWRIEGYVRRGANASVKPVLVVEGVVATVKRLFGIK